MTEAERINRFETAYNRIDRAMAEMIGGNNARRKHSFAAKARLLASRQRRLAKYAEFLVEISELRNALVHSRLEEDVYLAVPSEETVLELERIEQAAFSPERVTPRFEKPVVTIEPSDTLADVLELFRTDGYSRYPVYDKNGFVGLLTSNGVARWMAAHASEGTIVIDLTKVSVADVLEADHRRKAVEFLARNSYIDDVDHLFATRAKLEAVIITQSGRPEQPPIGMICAPDVAALRK